MGEIVEVAKVLVKPAMKLLEMCGNAVGTLYEPRYIRKMADAEAYRISRLNGAITESVNIPTTYENGNISMSTANIEDLVKRAEYRGKYQLLREQNNIENVIEKTYRELEHAPEVVNEQVDEDWTTRFFNIVKEINTDEMQYIWSKILAGEITKPGSFSMRTLETIRNLSQVEAKTFQKIIPFIVFEGDSFILLSNDEVHRKYGIMFSDILMLDECGLIKASGTLTMQQKINSKSSILFCNKELVLVAQSASEKNAEIQCGVYTLTNTGKELYQILSCSPNKEFFVDCAACISRENRGIKLTVHNVISIGEGSIGYENAIVREFYGIDK